jgi:hypothetical protein
MTGVAPEPLQPWWRFLAGFNLVDNKRLHRLGLAVRYDQTRAREPVAGTCVPPFDISRTRMSSSLKKPLIVGITGAFGAVYGVRLLAMLNTCGIEPILSYRARPS